jgi:hypothetical protein
VNELTIQDRLNKTLITLSAETRGRFWSYPVYTMTKVYDAIRPIYQGTCFIFNWECALAPGEEWATKMGLRIEKK